MEIQSKKFKDFLQEQYLQRLNRNSAYSIRAFAKNLQISDSALSQMIRGKPKITNRTIEKLGLTLGLELNQIKQFCENENQSFSFSPLKQDQFEGCTTWMYDAILEMTRLNDIELTPKKVAELLDINIYEAKAMIELLMRTGQLSIDDDGKWVDVAGNTTSSLDANYEHESLKRYQLSILKAVEESIKNTHIEFKDHSSLLIAAEQKQIPLIKEKIQKFKQEIAELVDSNKTNDSIYTLQINLTSMLKDITGDIHAQHH